MQLRVETPALGPWHRAALAGVPTEDEKELSRKQR